MKYEMLFCSAELTFDVQPMVTFEVLTQPGRHAFYAAQVLDCAAMGERFMFSSLPDGGEPIAISAAEVKQLAHWIRGNVQPIQGKFQTVWVANDPSIPF